ncbi:hypothetical protein [Roseivirga sp. E12]|uniref:hypothetical protein n=1 Tax=Roseivirga sp. E12 TaxID=2819237 RepID=UPI001ABD0C7A|nr:hypothetical protein [Roseivirga sp. E12]MBO3698856.1 hypothetical protein [Roseivirga sp. E12]
MRSLLRTTLILTVIFSASQVMAQSGNKTLLKTEQIAAKLELTDKQKADLDKELKANQETRKAQMEKIRAIREEMKRDAFVQRQEQMERMKNILTPEQWEKFQKLQKEGKGRLQRMRGNRGQNNVRGQRGQNGQRNFSGRAGMRPGRMMLRKKAIEKKIEEKKEKGGDGGDGGN